MTQRLTIQIVADDFTEKSVANAVRRAFNSDQPLTGSGTVKGVEFKVTPAPVGRKGNLADVRAWAEKKGYKDGYGTRGRIRQDILDAYAAAH